MPWPLVGHALKEIIDLTQSPQRSRSFLGSSVFICGSPASACQRGILPGSFPYTKIRKQSTRRLNESFVGICQQQIEVLQ